MQYVALLLIATLALVAAVPEPLTRRELEFTFESWKIQFGRKYDSATEYVKRMDVFHENHWTIVKHNAMNHTWTMAHNEFSDMTQEEFRNTHFGFGKVPTRDFLRTNAFANADPAKAADSIDWVAKGAVTPVKNQGQCGSCWSFSTTGALEGAYFLKNNKLVSLSEQNMVDCDNVDQGCNGGLMDNAFNFVKKNRGVCTEADYPYTGREGRCQTSCTKVDMTPSHTDVAQSEAALVAALNQQPVSIAIEADQQGFQFYSSGVFSGYCGTQLDHGVLAVGYGTENGQKYWKVKNSWGASWGASGYIKFQRGKAQQGGQCGILLSASFPNL